jgi:hypothetical protein
VNQTELGLREACWQAFLGLGEHPRGPVPKDWEDLRGVLADWLEDHGREEAPWVRADWLPRGREEVQIPPEWGPLRPPQSHQSLDLVGSRGPTAEEELHWWQATNREWLLWFPPCHVETRSTSDKLQLMVWEGPVLQAWRSRPPEQRSRGSAGRTTQEWLGLFAKLAGGGKAQ